MKNLVLLIALLSLVWQTAAQVAINSDNSDPDPSAGLEVKFINKGFLPPRMTSAQIALISLPADGLIVYCTTDNKLYAFSAAAVQWKEIAYGAGIITPVATCGLNLPVNHTAGAVAPVSKAVIYGTVTSVPGEPSKCWITHNLGASQQAASANDATEPSAGWYWQFNRLQGFKHDGGILTPAWTITSINESNDWLSGSDPCTSELGAVWRIPTKTEWYNVDNAGGWNTMMDPWSSLLKLHCAGYLVAANGSLSSRGTTAYYWSTTQAGTTTAWSFNFGTGYSGTYDSSGKAYGFPVRCLRE